MSIALEPSYILHRRAYRESSLLLEAFSEHLGRVGLIARGGRRSGSRQQGRFEPFQSLLLSWSGRGELPVVTGLELAPDRRVPLRGRALLGGFYVNELVMRLLQRNDPHPELFDSYQRVIHHLSVHGDEEAGLRVFERDLLGSIGYGLIADHEVDNGEPIEPDRTYIYVSERGPIKSSEPRAGLRVRGSVLIALRTEHFGTAEDLEGAKRLTRFLLASHLGDKPLASRMLYAPPP